jgi:hypothetical protein
VACSKALQKVTALVEKGLSKNATAMKSLFGAEQVFIHIYVFSPHILLSLQSIYLYVCMCVRVLLLKDVLISFTVAYN